MINKRKIKEIFPLTPYDLRNSKMAMKEKLKDKLLKFDEELDGIPL